MRTAQNLHQRRFPGAVLAREGQNLPAMQEQPYAVEGRDSREALPDATHLEEGGPYFFHSASRVSNSATVWASRISTPVFSTPSGGIISFRFAKSLASRCSQRADL